MKLLLDTHTLLWLAKRGCEADTARTKSHRRSRKYVDDQCGDHLGNGDQDYEAPESVTIERTSGYLPGKMPVDIRDQCPADPAASCVRRDGVARSPSCPVRPHHDRPGYL